MAEGGVGGENQKNVKLWTVLYEYFICVNIIGS